MTEANEAENSYLFATENASEVARLLERNVFINNAMGGALPEQANLEGITRILDIGCGPGGWVVDVAHSYPSTEVIGIDISDTMIFNARSQAQQHALQNVTFVKMNALQPLQFPDQYFDLVNMRAAVEYIPRTHWPALLRECYRITRLGGILRVLEVDRLAHTNSLAFETYHAFYSSLLYRRGYGFSPDGQTFGITPILGKLLHNAGYVHIRMKAYALDISYNTLFQASYRRTIMLRFEKVRLQLLERGLGVPEELASIYNTFLDDITRDTFCGVTYPLVFWGKK
jgi:ubiquinone/menaquinone biosynthesis C-methylase UbiE